MGITIRRILYIALLIRCTTVWGDGVIRDGMGARVIGRGAVNQAYADNGQLILDNPAGLANIQGDGFCELGIDVLLTELEYSDPDNPRGQDIDNPFPVGQLAFVRRIDADTVAGFGVFSHAGFASEYDLNGPAALPGLRHQKSIGALMRILPSIGYRLNDRLTVGANLGVAVSHMELEGPYFLQGPSPFAGTPTIMDMQGTGAALSWGLGLQYQLNSKTSVGLSYVGEASFDLRGSTKIEIPTLQNAIFDSRLEMKWPRSLGLGLKHELCVDRTLGFDVQWYDWSSAFDQFDLHLTDPIGPIIPSLTGPRLLEQYPLNWRDSVSFRSGYEHRLPGAEIIRLGYIYHRNPIPNATLTPYIQTTLQHVFSVGYGWQTQRCAIDIAYQISVSDDERVNQSDFLGGDFDDSEVSTTAHFIAISFQRKNIR